MTNLNELWKYDLRKGNSRHPKNGACLYDAGMWLVYGKIGDNPPCSCPIIRAYAIGLNDAMPTKPRQLLKPFILRVVGNRDPKAEAARVHCIVLETARKVVPLALEHAKLLDQATKLRLLPDNASYKDIEHAASHAADAAYYAAYAASRAAYYAASAASCAAYAASAAASASASASASHAADAAIWNECITILDTALRIGKQSPEFDEQEVVESIRQFGIAAKHMETVR